MMTEVQRILQKIPGTKQMLSIPGIGVLTVIGFLAEVGDLNNYDHEQQIFRLDGLNLTENSSGKWKGNTGISKRGRSRLRGILFSAMLPMVSKNWCVSGSITATVLTKIIASTSIFNQTI